MRCILRTKACLFFSLVLILTTLHPANAADGQPAKKALNLTATGKNLLAPDAWRPWQKGFQRQDGVFLCDNGPDSNVQRGVSQTVRLNQTSPQPIVATAWSKAENVGGGRNSDYSLYLDLTYTDGTPLWGRVDTFSPGSHDWQQARVIIFPEKPVASLSFHMLLRRHTGKAWFRDPQLKVIDASLFDGIPVQPAKQRKEGFLIRDVRAESDFVSIERTALNLSLESHRSQSSGTTFFDVTLSDTSGKDRAVTLIYTIPLPESQWLWLHHPRQSDLATGHHEYLNTASFSAGANGRLSRYPFGAVADSDQGIALGIDMSRPAFFRVGYNAGSRELFIAYDIGLTPEKPSARLRFCKFNFDPEWQFRSALSHFYDIFPNHFRRRISRQGLWMPFAKISDVKNWQDFGFRFKEGNNETKWDDQHDIITFRYTEPMTWWMKMSEDLPRNLAAALAEARRLANEKNDVRAKAFLTSGYHDETGQFTARLRNTPWCNGAVWSINSMPKVPGRPTDFQNKWNPKLRDSLYGPKAAAHLDGEYIDSSEGYVTDELNFRRDHFAAADTPLTFSLNTRKPAIFRGLIVFEYTRALARDVHAMNKYMMANSTPIRLCWLAPMLDVMGSETNWNPGGSWRPMSDRDLLYRRALCKAKPYCFLMNTEFENFSHAKIEKYMKRSLAYGMFPGFFSHNASQGHYFTRPELYERDRNLFKKYIPLCKLIAEAGWQPITNARSDNPSIHLERFGTQYLTAFNNTPNQQTATITIDTHKTDSLRDLVTGQTINSRNGKATLTLAPENVAVLQMD